MLGNHNLESLEIPERPPGSRNADRAKLSLLRAAQMAFSQRSYGLVGIRTIAAKAQLNGSLIRRYFGSKQGLFEAAMTDALDVSPMIACEREDFGKHVAMLYFDKVMFQGQALPMMTLGAGDPEARAVSVDVADKRLLAPLAQWLGGKNSHERAVRIIVLTSGLFTTWRLLPDRENKSMQARLRRWFEESLQAIVDE